MSEEPSLRLAERLTWRFRSSRDLAAPGEDADDMSLLTKIATDAAEAVDWDIVEAIGVPDVLPAVVADLLEHDPLRGEALLHAWPDDAPQPAGVCPEQYSGERWHAVEAEMERLRAEGLTASRAQVELVALSAWERAMRDFN
jgi:CO/xanthine dehydrogenase Mo-binding subunit